MSAHSGGHPRRWPGGLPCRCVAVGDGEDALGRTVFRSSIGGCDAGFGRAGT